MKTKPHSRHTILFTLLTALLLAGTSLALSQTEISPLSGRIQQQRHLMQLGEQEKFSPAAQGYLWATLAATYADAADLSSAESAYNHALQLFRKDPTAKANYATAMDNLGALYLIFGRTDDAESARRNALALRLEIGEPLGIASSRQHLAEVALAEHHFKDAEKQADEAYRSMISNREPDRSAIVATIVTLSFARCRLHRCDEALSSIGEAMRLGRQAFQPDSLPWAHLQIAHGFTQWKTGDSDGADRSLQEGVRIMRLNYTVGHPTLNTALLIYRDYLKAMHRKPEQQEIEQQIASSQQIASFSSTPRIACNSCTVSTFSLR